VILLDTHAWVWWVHGDDRLGGQGKEAIDRAEEEGLGVSVISCWEVAKLVERRRLELPHPLAEWIALALAYPGVRLLELTPAIAIESTRLPGDFHRDPADQILVATARTHGAPIATADRRILAYDGVRSVALRG
jgi:PIN domain nuclease of toxin-antitoxin system